MPFRGWWPRQNMFSKWNNHATYNTVHTLSSDRILYSNVCMVVCLVRFSYLIPGIHLSPRCQEEPDPICTTLKSYPMEGSLVSLTQPQRRDTQTLIRAEKDHIRSYKVRSSHKYSDISVILSHRVGWRTGTTILTHSYSHSHIPSSINYNTTEQTNKHRIVDMHSIIYTVRIV